MTEVLIAATVALVLHLAGRVAQRLMPVYGSDPLAKRMAFAVMVFAVAVTGVTGAMALSWLLHL